MRPKDGQAQRVAVQIRQFTKDSQVSEINHRSRRKSAFPRKSHCGKCLNFIILDSVFSPHPNDTRIL